jgi:hypothetical protein
MYYTGIDPYSGKKVYIARNIEEKRRQKEYFFWYKKEQWPKGATAQRDKVKTVEREKGRKGERGKTSK